MVTSRFIPEIVQEFESVPTLEVRASEADVKQYLDWQMYRLPKYVQRDPVFQETVKDRLVEVVDGMLATQILRRLIPWIRF
jgi:hypothetical protein